jgi:hypothetical protein
MKKANLLKYAPAGAIIATAAAACGLGGYIIAQWPAINATIKPAIISGTFTIVAAMGGALVVFWQLRKQAENTARANRHTEALKLKKEVYEEMASLCRKGSDSAAKLYHYVQRFAGDVGLLREVYSDEEKFPPELVPKQRYQVVKDLQNDLIVKVSRIIRAIQRWKIINPKVGLFEYALHSVMHDLQAATKQYHLKTMAILPFSDDMPLKMAFKLPNEAGMAALFAHSDDVLRTVGRVQQWIADMQVAFQNELLGELFESQVKTREDPDPTDDILAPFKVLRLDRYDELVSHFKNDTEWGRQMTAMSAEMAEEELATPPLTTEPRPVKDLGQPPLFTPRP